MKELIITKKNGETIRDKINGPDKRIIENVNSSNFLNSCNSKNNIGNQIVKVNIIADATGILGCIQRNIEYNLNYSKENKCYLY